MILHKSTLYLLSKDLLVSDANQAQITVIKDAETRRLAMLKFIIGAGLALAASPVAASDRAIGPLTARVAVHDLDLTAPSGRAALDQRLKAAVGIVCPDPRTSILIDMMDHWKCLKTAQRSVARQREVVLARVEALSNPVGSGTR